MRRFTSILVVVLCCGAAFATPRWGDDFDWLGDTLTIDRIASIVNVGGDTLLCASYKNGIYAVVQHADTSFELLFHRQLPITSFQDNYPPINGLTYPDLLQLHYDNELLVNRNQIRFGFPNGTFQWDRVSPPVYTGSVHHGFVYTPDTVFTSPSRSSGGDSLIHYNYNTGAFTPGFGISHYLPVTSHQRLLYGNRIYSLGANDSLLGYSFVAGVSDWAVRWPYGYGVSADSNQLVTVNLSLDPPSILSRVPINTAGFIRIIQDTLITIQGNRWQCWTLSHPDQPVSLGITTLPFRLFWLEDTTLDSLYFGWSGKLVLPTDENSQYSYTTLCCFLLQIPY